MNAVVARSPMAARPGDTMADGGVYVSRDELARIWGDPMRGRKELRKLLATERERTQPKRGPAPLYVDKPAEKPDNVRLAGIADEKAIFDLLVMDLQENAARVAPIDEDKLVSIIHAGTRRKGGIIGVIEGDDGQPVATTILLPEQWFWSRQYYYSSLVHFVHPEHRRSNLIDDLIRFDRWAVDGFSQQFGYRIYLVSGVIATKRVRDKILLFKRKLAQVGATFMYPAPLSDEED